MTYSILFIAHLGGRGHGGTPALPAGLMCVSPVPVFPTLSCSPSPAVGGTPRAASDSASGVLPLLEMYAQWVYNFGEHYVWQIF